MLKSDKIINDELKNEDNKNNMTTLKNNKNGLNK